MRHQNIFFDLDGTLHKEDIFFSFILFLAKKRIFNTLILFPLLLQAVVLHLIFAKGKIGINLALFCLTLGTNQTKQKQFFTEFTQQFKLTPFPKVMAELQQHLSQQKQIFLISGSPEPLIKPLYSELLTHRGVKLIGSQITHKSYAMRLSEHCYAENKVKMLDRFFPKTNGFEIGYSDSLSDKPIFERCRKVVLIDKNGKISKSINI
ncbi:hypothetical protein BMT54_06700 [Pasteurellaceae bacterium 15-036681]|nr:hypothetical protein BMT54_06700 [Pasteurellaceae bacterium 15-036681]